MKNLTIFNPIYFLAFGFGSGKISPAPGTWGTIAGLIFAIIIYYLGLNYWLELALIVIAFFAGIYICDKTSHDMGVHDHGSIVWDEIVAIWLVIFFMPEKNTQYFFLAFLIFRIFDIFKPYPIKILDKKVSGGLGIMIDDLLAAVYSLIVIYLYHIYI